jgi:hypothetical protein
VAARPSVRAWYLLEVVARSREELAFAVEGPDEAGDVVAVSDLEPELVQDVVPASRDDARSDPNERGSRAVVDRGVPVASGIER